MLANSRIYYCTDLQDSIVDDAPIASLHYATAFYLPLDARLIIDIYINCILCIPSTGYTKLYFGIHRLGLPKDIRKNQGIKQSDKTYDHKMIKFLINQVLLLDRAFPSWPPMVCCGRWYSNDCLNFEKILNRSMIGNIPISHPPSNIARYLGLAHFQSNAPSSSLWLCSPNFDTFWFDNHSYKSLDNYHNRSYPPWYSLDTSQPTDLTISKSGCWFHDDLWFFHTSYRKV